ncbi:MAG: aldehyde dehydrogenase family protein [Anaerolineae bacterium]|nr:aldehyde dehydrogenase family protein [Anaerolineae bacterium]
MVTLEKQAAPNTAQTWQQTQIEVKNPVTGQVIGSVPAMNADDVRQAATKARAAQPAWEVRGAKERAALLRRWADMLWDDQKTAIQKVRAETGKNEIGAWLEVFVVDNVVAYYHKHAAHLLRPQGRRSLIPMKQTARVYYKAHGVAGFITPWNYPLNNAMIDLIPALIAGNTVLLKPSEITPYTAIYAIELMYKAGIPRDVIQVVTGAGVTGAALVDVVDYISFTGSTATGRKIAMRAAERLIPCSLELGGKDPLIVLNDADVNLAAAGTLVGALENCGQVCISTERVYVEDGIYDQYVERIKYYADQLTLGSGDGFDVHVGSLTNEREILRAEQQVADAVAKGATVIHGGKRRPDLGPLFYEPTILTGVNHNMDVMREETFGPLIPVMRVKDANEAIKLANDNQYGLSASIFTSDLKRGEQLATRIESGDVCVNATQWVFGTISLPMGGVKNSGMGRRNGPEGLMRFVKPQSVLVDNQLMQKPNLTLGDPFAIRVALLLRSIRRAIPFLGV